MMKYFTFLILICTFYCSIAQTQILVDGIFSEWQDYPIDFEDPNGDSGTSAVDFGQLQIANDKEFLFFLLEVGSELNLQNENEISIFLDTDNDETTGLSINGIGAELEYSFGDRRGAFYKNGNTIFLGHEDIGLVTSPTVTSDIFEIAIERDVQINGEILFSGESLSITFIDEVFNGDVLPSNGSKLTYTYNSETNATLPSYSIAKSQTSALRVMSYNVLFNGLFEEERKDEFARIFKATQPDIIGLQEIYDYSSGQVADQMEDVLPSEVGQQWYHAMEGPDCHAISRYPILGSAFIPGYNANAGNGAFLIDLPEPAEDLLLIVAHPPCCSNDEGRQIEVDLIMEFVREAKRGNGPLGIKEGAPIIILGDMNLVGDNKQLETLLTGNISDESEYGPDFNPDWDGSDFLDCNPYVTGLPFSFTWYDEGSSFSPGKLDYIIYSGSALDLQNQYGLFTPGLSQDSLMTYDLKANDVVVASDHLPLVADFRFKMFSSSDEVRSIHELGIQKIYPNPADQNQLVTIEYVAATNSKVEIVDASGRVIHSEGVKSIQTEPQKLRLNSSLFSKGVYLVKLTSHLGISTKKFVVN